MRRIVLLPETQLEQPPRIEAWRAGVPKSLAVAIGYLALVWSCACSSSSTGTGFPNESFIEVDPAQFGVPCSREASDGGHAFMSYVATLIALDPERPDAPGEPVVSSPPSPCFNAVRFARNSSQGGAALEFGQPYAAEILGFDRSGLRARKAGGPAVVADGQTVDPLWRGSCGRGGPEDAGVRDEFTASYLGPQLLVSGRTVTLRGCTLSLISDGD